MIKTVDILFSWTDFQPDTNSYMQNRVKMQAACNLMVRVPVPLEYVYNADEIIQVKEEVIARHKYNEQYEGYLYRCTGCGIGGKRKTKDNTCQVCSQEFEPVSLYNLDQLPEEPPVVLEGKGVKFISEFFESVLTDTNTTQDEELDDEFDE